MSVGTCRSTVTPSPRQKSPRTPSASSTSRVHVSGEAKRASALAACITILMRSIGVTTTADVLLNHGAVPASRLDGSSYADARLLARHPDTDIPGSPADDRAMADDVGTPAGEAARLRLSLKNARTNKKHTSFFKAIKAGGRIGAQK